MTLKAISAQRLFDGVKYHDNSALLWEGTSIKAVVPITQLPVDIEHQHFEDAIIAPGFIDIQVNGGGDVMFNNDLSPSAVNTICRAHRSHGTAYLLPTLISTTPSDIQKALSAIDKAIEERIVGVLGIHLEGPWLNQEKKAHIIQSFFTLLHPSS